MLDESPRVSLPPYVDDEAITKHPNKVSQRLHLQIFDNLTPTELQIVIQSKFKPHYHGQRPLAALAQSRSFLEVSLA